MYQNGSLLFLDAHVFVCERLKYLEQFAWEIYYAASREISSPQIVPFRSRACFRVQVIRVILCASGKWIREIQHYIEEEIVPASCTNCMCIIVQLHHTSNCIREIVFPNFHVLEIILWICTMYISIYVYSK